MLDVSPRVSWAVNVLLGCIFCACQSDARKTQVPVDPCQTHPKTVSAVPKGGDYEQAAQRLSEALTAQDRGDVQLAEELLEKSLRLDPAHGLAHLSLSEVQLFLGRAPEDRLATVAKAVLLLPDNPRAHLRYAEVSQELGDLGNAVLHARCAADRKPDYFEAQMLLARVEQEQGNLPTALQAAEAATQVDPKSSTAWVLKAEIESQQNKLALAAASMKKAADLVGRSAPLYRKAADLAEAAQDAQTAAALRARADELAPPPKKRKLRPLRKSRVRRMK